MSTINIAAIETDVATVFHSAILRVEALTQKIPAAVHAVVTDAEQLAAIATPIVAAVAPQDVAALNAVKALLNAFDAAAQNLVPAADGSTAVTLPNQVIAMYNEAKAAVLAFENSL